MTPQARLALNDQGTDYDTTLPVMSTASISELEDLKTRAQLALQRENNKTAQDLLRQLVDKVPVPSSSFETSAESSQRCSLALQASFQLQNSLHITEFEGDEEEEHDTAPADEEARVKEETALLRKALDYAKGLAQPTKAQEDLELALVKATLGNLLLESTEAKEAAEKPKTLFDASLDLIQSASTKRKNELLTALRPTSEHQPSKTNTDDIAGALQIIYDAPSSHIIHLANGLPVDDLDALGKSIQAFFQDQVPGSMGTLGKAEAALNVGEVLIDKLEDIQDFREAEEEESEPTEDEKRIETLARSWLQQGARLHDITDMSPLHAHVLLHMTAVELFEQAQREAPASSADELKFQVSHKIMYPFRQLC